MEALRLRGPICESMFFNQQRHDTACSSVGYLVHCLETILQVGHRPEIGENDRMLMVVIVE